MRKPIESIFFSSSFRKPLGAWEAGALALLLLLASTACGPTPQTRGEDRAADEDPARPAATEKGEQAPAGADDQAWESQYEAQLADEQGVASEDQAVKKEIYQDIWGTYESAKDNPQLQKKKAEPERNADGKLNPFGVFSATRTFLRDGSRNPLLEDKCRKQALENAAAHWRQLTGTPPRKSREHVADARAKFASAQGVSYTAYLNHIVHCEDFCRPLVTTLLDCHTLSVSRLGHSIVFFDYAQSSIKKSEGQIISEAARQARRNPSLKVLLVGRASKLTKTGDADFNMRLAQDRADAVRRKLLARGVSKNRVHVMAFGWEPPQIGPAIARRYGFEDYFQEVGKAQMNQSVVIVLFPGEEGDTTG